MDGGYWGVFALDAMTKPNESDQPRMVLQDQRQMDTGMDGRSDAVLG